MILLTNFLGNEAPNMTQNIDSITIHKVHVMWCGVVCGVVWCGVWCGVWVPVRVCAEYSIRGASERTAKQNV